jgi:hypothetical protein
MVSPVNPVSQLVAAIRTQLATQSEQASAKQTSGRQKSSRAGSPVPLQGIESLVQEKIKRIDRNDPDRGRKAFRIFLETILLSQFGEGLINDPGFYQMVDDVQYAMESDAEINEAIRAAVQHLLGN